MKSLNEIKSTIYWTSVNDIKPESGQLVICADFKKRKVFFGYYSKEMDKFFDKNGSGIIVTHFSELPTINKKI